MNMTKTTSSLETTNSGPPCRACYVLVYTPEVGVDLLTELMVPRGALLSGVIQCLRFGSMAEGPALPTLATLRLSF